jgi:putative glutamine amidotransferase
VKVHQAAKPIVLVPACNREVDGMASHTVGKKYVDAVRLAGCLPLVVPAAGLDDLEALLNLAHGVLLTGSPSNVHPAHFSQPVADEALPLDPARDAWTLPLVPLVLARGMPLLAICRGAQEVNVALGGTLHQEVHAVGPYDDHRSNDDDPLEVQYGARHPARVVPGGALATIVQCESIEINSLHGQAVDRLAPGLQADAFAPDGVIEAFSHPGAAGFNLCVQWHPEWQAADNPVSMQLLATFGQACKAYRERAKTPLP